MHDNATLPCTGLWAEIIDRCSVARSSPDLEKPNWRNIASGTVRFGGREKLSQLPLVSHSRSSLRPADDLVGMLFAVQDQHEVWRPETHRAKAGNARPTWAGPFFLLGEENQSPLCTSPSHTPPCQHLRAPPSLPPLIYRYRLSAHPETLPTALVSGAVPPPSETFICSLP